MKDLKVGFIGLGLMGGPMALNIFKNGYPLSVYNRSEKRLAQFKKLGIKTYSSPADLAQNSDVVITIVTGPKDVEEVGFGVNGIVNGAKKGLIVVDMSTIGPAAARKIGKDFLKKGIDFIDAPVTGGTVGAEKGELTIFVGGDERIFKKINDLLLTMGKEAIYMGPSGSGQAIKLVNNLIAGETVVVLAEAFLLGEALGIKRQKTMDTLKNVFALSPNMKNKMPLMASKKYDVSFSVANIKKDLGLALQELKNKNSLPLLKSSESLYKKGMDLGMSDLDLAAVIEVLEKDK